MKQNTNSILSFTPLTAILIYRTDGKTIFCIFFLDFIFILFISLRRGFSFTGTHAALSVLYALLQSIYTCNTVRLMYVYTFSYINVI